MKTATTVLEAMAWLLDRWDSIHLQVKQDGKLQLLPLTEVKDQRSVLRFVNGKLSDWAKTTYPRGQKAQPVEEDAPDMPSTEDLWPEEHASQLASGR